jgi:hypothetical protein
MVTKEIKTMSTNQTPPEPTTDSGFAELSSLASEIASEPDTDLSPTQAISDDGRVIELGENGDGSLHKDI